MDDSRATVVREKADARALRFGPTFREREMLDDGFEVLLRPVTPADKRLLAAGLARLSPQSSFLRFMSPKRRLSEKELCYLTEVDGVDHFALGAVLERPDGTEEGVGVARFVRIPGEPEVAEPAITIADEYQGKGLGGLLLRRLVQAARERGVLRFRCYFHAGNERIRSLLDCLGPDVAVPDPERDEADAVKAEFVLPKPPIGERLASIICGTGVYRAFSQIARGRLRLSERAEV